MIVQQYQVVLYHRTPTDPQAFLLRFPPERGLVVRPNNTFGFLVPEATFCREDAQNRVSGTRFCGFSRDRHGMVQM